MYINPFWAGVLVTILTEFGTLVVLALIKGGKNNDDQ